MILEGTTMNVDDPYGRLGAGLGEVNTRIVIYGK